MTTVELTRFRVEPDREDELLRAQPAMPADFHADRTGFLHAGLVQLPDHQWLDIVTWNSHQDFAASRAKGANWPSIRAFFDTIAQLISSEESTQREGSGRSCAPRGTSGTDQPTTSSTSATRKNVHSTRGASCT
jgi:hypothetical protein